MREFKLSSPVPIGSAMNGLLSKNHTHGHRSIAKNGIPIPNDNPISTTDTVTNFSKTAGVNLTQGPSGAPRSNPEEFINSLMQHEHMVVDEGS